jgi:membrane-bound lytic murein transglycosylase F
MIPAPWHLCGVRECAVKQSQFVVAVILAVGCGREAPAPPPPKPVKPAIRVDTGPVPKPSEAPKIAPPKSEPIARDLDAITADGTLRVLFTFNSTGYFIYRGETMGYEYELLDRFARESHLKLRPVIVRDSAALYERLNHGDGDIVAAQLAATADSGEVLQTAGLYETAPVLVQRGPEAPTAGTTPTVKKALTREQKETSPSTVTIRARLIATPRELAGQQVHLPRVSPYRARLVELNSTLDNDIDVVEVDESSDKLIQRLSEGEIGYTVAAENLAQLRAGEYTNLIVKPAIGPPQPIVWAVRRNAPQLVAALNRWIEAKRKASLLAVLYRKYFLDRRGFLTRSTSPYLTAETGTLSPFDDAFREYAAIPGWDWRLVAAQAYQESRFNPKAHSWAGAIGLMQIMPRTAKSLKVNANDPRSSIEGACRYLWQIDDAWKDSITDERERIKFILASYNVGTGHVQDAVRLAEKYGDNPKSWTDVAYWLVRKSKRSVYEDPVVKHGYARGTEPVTYVDEILVRFANYRQFVKKEPPAADPSATPAPLP